MMGGLWAKDWRLLVELALTTYVPARRGADCSRRQRPFGVVAGLGFLHDRTRKCRRFWTELKNLWVNRSEDRGARTSGEDDQCRAGERLEVVETQVRAACT